MNKTYRLIWSTVARTWVAVSEIVKARGKRASGALLLAASGAVLAAPPAPTQLPTGGQLVGGSASVAQSGTVMNINQSSQRAAINWQTFNVGARAQVNFTQPGATSVMLNRVLDSNPSQIFGRITANGQIFLTNPNGVYFAPGSSVDVGGLVATTHGISTLDFMAGNYRFTRNGATGSVINDGSLNAGLGGYIALLAPEVRNNGVIVAQMGTVAFAAGEAYELQFDAKNALANILVEPATIKALVDNGNAVQAPGGLVILSAQAADQLQGSVVNNSGSIEARGITNIGGVIRLDAGNGQTTVSGLLDTSSANGQGGRIAVTGARVLIDEGARLDATGNRGGGEILVGGSWQNSDSSVRQATGTYVAQSAVLDASATGDGNGGTVVAWSDITNAASVTRVYGTLLARGGVEGGDGGRIETSGHWLDTAGVKGDASSTRGNAGLWLFDPYNVTITSANLNGGFVSSSGTDTWSPTVSGSTILNTDINAKLEAGTNVTVMTGASGAEIGDITVAAAITKSTGGTDVTLKLQAANSIIVNQPIANTGGAGKLHVTLDADNDNGSRDGGGVIVLNNNISTGGGNLNFGTGATLSINGVSTRVGGDVYVGGGSAVTLSTAGGNVAVNGEMIIANTAGLNVTTAGGNVTFSGLLNSGNSYAGVNVPGGIDWATAVSAAASGTGAATGDTYLATITSRLENALAGQAANYNPSWLGARRVTFIGTDNSWRWVTGPESKLNGGQGQIFFNQNGTSTSNGSGGTTVAGQYSNWSSGEPNNYNGANLTVESESALQFVGSVGQWNDLPTNGAALTYYVRETNLAPSPLTINAGSGTVTFSAAAGALKPLGALSVTAGTIAINGGGVTTGMTGNGATQTYNGNITLGSASTVLTMNDAPTSFTLAAGKSITNATGADATLAIKTTANIILASNSSISSSAGRLNTILWADSDGNQDGYISLSGAQITTNGGHAWLGGGAQSVTGWNGLTVGSGAAWGNTTQQNGINMYAGSSISTGAGNVKLTGATAQTGDGYSCGLELGWHGGAASITTTSGNIDIVGTNTANAWGVNEGISVYGITIAATGGGNVTLQGTGGYGAGADGIGYLGTVLANSGTITLIGTKGSTGSGIDFMGGTIGYKAGTSVTASSSNINLTTDTISGTGTALQSTGTLNIEPLTAGTTIGVGTGTGTLSLPSAYFSSNITDGFSGITVGGNTSGNINVDGAVSYSDPLTLKTAGNIVVNAGSTLTGAVAGGDGIKSSLVLWSDADSSNGGYVQIGLNAPVTTNGGGLWIGGGSATASWTPYSGATALTVGNSYAQGTSSYGTGVYLGNGAISTSGGNVAIFGKTAVTSSGAANPNPDVTNWASGIYSVFGNGNGVVNINSGTGSILLHGINVLQNVSGGEGIYLNGATLTSSATSGDAITLIGDSSAANGGVGTRGAGVTLIGWTNQSVNISATGGGNIVVDGTSAAVSSGTGLNYGVRVSSGGGTTQLATSGGGNITITGTVRDANAAYSVGFETATDSITSSGNLTVTGTTNNGNNKPVYLGGPVTVTGTTTLTASGQDITATNTSNDFGGAVSVVAGANVQLKDSNALTLGAASFTGNYTARALGGDLTIAGNITKSAGADSTATFAASGNVFLNSAIAISSASNKLNVVLNSDSDGSGAGNIQLSTGASIASNGGNITLGGGSALDGSGNARGNASSGGNFYSEGIAVMGATLDASGSGVGGNITMNAQGAADSGEGLAFNTGGYLGSGATMATVKTNNAGTITLNGTAGSTASTTFRSGVDLWFATLQTASGAINITGTGGNSSGGSGGGDASGVFLAGAGWQGSSVKILSASGPITLTGTKGTGNGSDVRIGSASVVIGEDGSLVPSSTSNIRFVGNSADISPAAGAPSQSVVIKSAGTFDVESRSTPANKVATTATDFTFGAGTTLTWNNTTLTYSAPAGITINTVWSVNGVALDLEPGSGSVFTTGNANGTFNGRVDFYAADGTTPRAGAGFLTIGGSGYTVVNSMTPFGNNSMNNSSGKFALGASIDAAAGGTQTGGWVGSNAAGFVLDGLGHTISNMTIAPNYAYEGLFGSNYGTLRNLGVSSLVFTANAYQSLGLVGVNYAGGLLENIRVSGTNSIACSNWCGTLIGYNAGGTLNNFSLAGNIAIDAVSGGGAVGWNQTGTVSNGTSSATVTSPQTGYVALGGIIGQNWATASNLSNSGGVTLGANRTGSGVDTRFGNGIGGLIGENGNGMGSAGGTLTNSTFSGSVTTGNYSYFVGGLVGYNHDIIDGSSSSGTVTVGTNSQYVGGLTGSNNDVYAPINSFIQNASQFSGSVITGTNSTYVGGIAGFNGHVVTSTTSHGTVSAAAGTTYVGGLAGYNTSTITSSTNTSAVSTGGVAATLANGVANSYLGTLTGYSQGIVSATPIAITASVSPVVVTYGTAPAYTLQLVSGSLGSGDALTQILTGTPTCSACTNVGSYSVLQGTVARAASYSSIYSFTWQDGSLTVNAKPLTVSGLSGTNRNYNGSTVDALSGTATLVGLVSGESLTIGGTTNGTLSSPNAGIRSVTTAITIADNGSYLASNYILTQPTLANVTIGQAPLSVTGLSGTSRNYNGSAVDALSGTATLVGLVPGESLTIGGTTNGTLSSANAGSRSVTTSITIADNGSYLAGNYTLTQPTLANVTIAQAPLSVTGLAGTNRNYNGSVVDALSGTATLVGLVPGESLTIGGTTNGTLSSANAGGRSVTTAITIADNGSYLAGNYTLTQPTLASVTIGQASLTVTANAANKNYDGLAYSGGNGVVYAGFVNSESTSNIGGTLSYGGNSQGARSAGSYVITPNGLTSVNYMLAFVDGKLTIDSGTQPSTNLNIPPPPSQTTHPTLPTPSTNPPPISGEPTTQPRTQSAGNDGGGKSGDAQENGTGKSPSEPPRTQSADSGSGKKSDDGGKKDDGKTQTEQPQTQFVVNDGRDKSDDKDKEDDGERKDEGESQPETSRTQSAENDSGKNSGDGDRKEDSKPQSGEPRTQFANNESRDKSDDKDKKDDGEDNDDGKSQPDSSRNQSAENDGGKKSGDGERKDDGTSQSEQPRTQIAGNDSRDKSDDKNKEGDGERKDDGKSQPESSRNQSAENDGGKKSSDGDRKEDGKPRSEQPRTQLADNDRGEKSGDKDENDNGERKDDGKPESEQTRTQTADNDGGRKSGDGDRKDEGERKDDGKSQPESSRNQSAENDGGKKSGDGDRKEDGKPQSEQPRTQLADNDRGEKSGDKDKNDDGERKDEGKPGAEQPRNQTAENDGGRKSGDDDRKDDGKPQSEQPRTETADNDGGGKSGDDPAPAPGTPNSGEPRFAIALLGGGTPGSEPGAAPVPPAASPGAGSGSETSGDGTAGTAGGSGPGSISVSLVRQPSIQENGIISVSVPKETATSGNGFTFSLPAQLLESTAGRNPVIRVTTLTGDALPAWLRFVPETKIFVASAVPDGAFPIQVIVTIEAQHTTVVISERGQ